MLGIIHDWVRAWCTPRQRGHSIKLTTKRKIGRIGKHQLDAIERIIDRKFESNELQQALKQSMSDMALYGSSVLEIQDDG